MSTPSPPQSEYEYPLNAEKAVPGTNGNLFKTVLTRGDSTIGHPEKGYFVTVHYRGTFDDDLEEREFDSSYSRNEPFQFVLGEGQVIKGWDIGIATMFRGEKALLKCKPSYAYGEMGAGEGLIPPQATLQFEVELISFVASPENKPSVWEAVRNMVFPINEEIVVPSTEGNIWKTVFLEGELNTTPIAGSHVKIHYKGHVGSPDGPEFDNTYERNLPIEFQISTGAVILGWDYGIATMNISEKCLLKVLPDYGYGVIDSPKIPAHSTLYYYIELLDWCKYEDISEQDLFDQRKRDEFARTIVKNIRRDCPDRHPDSFLLPSAESLVTCSVVARDSVKILADNENDAQSVMTVGADDENEDQSTRTLLDPKVKPGDNVFFCKENWQFEISELPLPIGLEAAIRSMRKGERAQVTVDSKIFPYFKPKEGDQLSEKIPLKEMKTPLWYDITLHDYTVVNLYTMPGPQKFLEAQRKKVLGNKHFAAGDFTRAERYWVRALDYVKSPNGLESLRDDCYTLIVTLHSNLAQLCLSRGRWTEALAHCNTVMNMDEKNPKVLFRRGKCLTALGDWDEAQKCFKTLLEIQTENAEAAAELVGVIKLQKEFDRKEKRKFGKMFA